ncbi:hypothetical protein SAMN06264364_11960 [Quadrisphaera granulorum]|uniref:Cell wall binding repeat protein n=1 Tax=Quadrisphaera granulorum TaxID=317664 RepID=A0A316A3L4_9ACTN|nr:hypothetical protein [Quadrisphaera granulorum]PWJ52566.1 hypothetical protein BXY45_11960 [Quadrisphaera granulorum]SZE97616.1 hypothetical protein SAMN06264364_11960 [Quadrisphaera granulorum]
MHHRPSSTVLAAGAVALALALAGCTADSPSPATSSPANASTTQAAPADGDGHAVAAVPARATTLVSGTSADALAAGTSAALFTSATRALFAGSDDVAAQSTAAAAAERLRIPVLVTGDSGAQEISRLGAQVVPVGAQAQEWASQRGLVVADDAATLLLDAQKEDAQKEQDDDGDAPAASTATPTAVVLTTGAPQDATAVATAAAAGASAVILPGGDPRADGALVEQLGKAPQVPVVALGDAFGPADRLEQRLGVVRTGVQIPAPEGLGGQLPLAGRRLVALYGHPGTPSLGVLGEQDDDATIARAQQVAQQYAGLDALAPAPALEVIATVASSSPGSDGDYSTETPVAELRPLVDRALAAGLQVVIDLQPGRATFLEQAKAYEELLALPGVGLALDPEWRLAPGQQHLDQIGSVSAAEVDETSAWLAQLVRERQLPQKVFLLHQFRTSMVTGRASLDTSHDELVFVVHADGAGAPGEKEATYRALQAGAPQGVVWGWKNFYDEDSPTFTPQQTVAEQPSPVFVSYQ